MHSFVCCYLHCVFATHERRTFLTPDIHSRLWPYLGGIARQNGMTALAVGGVADHVHVLVSLPSKLAIAKAMQLIKGNSSKWLHKTFPQLHDFAWQEGCGAFSVGVSGLETTKRYIASQPEHHRRRTFRVEIEIFLRKHGMTWEERDLER